MRVATFSLRQEFFWKFSGWFGRATQIASQWGTSAGCRPGRLLVGSPSQLDRLLPLSTMTAAVSASPRTCRLEPERSEPVTDVAAKISALEP